MSKKGENVEVDKLPPGVRTWGGKYKASVFCKSKSLYVGLFNTVEQAKVAQIEFRKQNNIEIGQRGRPKKVV